MEKRKLKEIEHSKKLREIFQGFERISDTHANEQEKNIEDLIIDKELFNEYFSNMKYYAITKSSEEYKFAWLKDRCGKGVKIIDFACGNGENGIFAAQNGSECIGIDIDPTTTDNANANAERFGVADHCEFVVMDGENMTFEDNTFDLGVEYGALHHVDLDKALAELSRVLRKDAEMICIEALRHNPLIHWYRKRTPDLRTEWEVEHILGVESLKIMKRYFRKVEVKFFHLTSLILVPIRKTFLFPILLPFFDFLDRIILSTKFVGKYGWIMSIQLSDPIK
jgi:ubiquinone/menaquinone biosynthesis C-methylase UbiE